MLSGNLSTRTKKNALVQHVLSKHTLNGRRRLNLIIPSASTLYFFVLTGTVLNGRFREHDIFSVPFKVRRTTLVNRSGNKVN